MMIFEEFELLYEASGPRAEPEFYVYFDNYDTEYMIIKFDKGPSFQRCVPDGSGETFYKYGYIINSLPPLLIIS